MKNTHRRFFILLLTVVCAFLIYQACTKKVVAPTTKRAANVKNTPTYTTIYETPSTIGGTTIVYNNGLTAPNDFNIGISNGYGNGINAVETADYFYMLSQMNGGESKYWFYGKSNGNPYPSPITEFLNTANGYTTIDLPSHSVTISPNTYGKVSKMQYTIKDSGGNVVMYCNDTKGGMSGYGSNDKRSNNHTRQCHRYLPIGVYTIEYKNISEDDILQTFRFGRAGINDTEFFVEQVSRGQTITKTLNLFDNPSNAFKLNCNYY